MPQGIDAATLQDSGMCSWIPEGYHSVTPRLVCDDAPGLVRFLREAFDASGEFSETMPSIMRIGDATIMVSQSGPRPPTNSFFYVYVENVDETYDRALRAGATTVEPPGDMPYGDRRAMVSDLFGNDWQIATYGKAAV